VIKRRNSEIWPVSQNNVNLTLGKKKTVFRRIKISRVYPKKFIFKMDYKGEAFFNYQTYLL